MNSFNSAVAGCNSDKAHYCKIARLQPSTPILQRPSCPESSTSTKPPVSTKRLTNTIHLSEHNPLYLAVAANITSLQNKRHDFSLLKFYYAANTLTEDARNDSE